MADPTPTSLDEGTEPAPRADGENARVFVGEHFHQIKGAIADGLNGARVGEEKISRERAQQLATICMAAMSRVYPRAPWQDEIDAAVSEFGGPDV